VGGFILILNKTGCVSAKTETGEQHATKDPETTNDEKESKDITDSTSGDKTVSFSPAIVKHLTRYIEYKIEEANATILPDDAVVLNVKLKCTNNSEYEYHFYSSFLGARVGEDNYGPDPYSPSGSYNSIPPRSFKRLEFNFRLPRFTHKFNLDFYDLDKIIGTLAFTVN
jgi:hypothetical protein